MIRRRSPPRCSSRTRALTRQPLALRHLPATPRNRSDRASDSPRAAPGPRRRATGGGRGRGEPPRTSPPASSAPIVKVGLVTGWHPERAAGAAHEGRLSGAQLAAHEHHVAGDEPARQGGARGLRLAGVGALDDHGPYPNRSSWGRGTGAGRHGPTAARAAPAEGSPSSSGRPPEVLAQLLQHARGPQRGGRVVERVEAHRAPADLVYLRTPADLRDPAAGAGEQLGGEVPERADHARLDQLDLPVEVGTAGLDLSRPGDRDSPGADDL